MSKYQRKYDPTLPRPCALPGCGNTFTGHGSRRFCSRRCVARAHKERPHYKRPTLEYENAIRAKRVAQKVEKAPPCSICKETTARKSPYYDGGEGSRAHMVPVGIELCKRHFRGYCLFIRQNGYEQEDREDVFTAYLIRLTHTNSDRQTLMTMMREAFASRHKIPGVV